MKEHFSLYGSLCVLDSPELQRNLECNLARGFGQCEPLPERTGRLAVCGSGPSLRDYADELSGFDEVWAINGAYDFLLDRGLVPHGFIGCDPVPGLAEYLQRSHPNTTFYLSGLCDPSSFDGLTGRKIKLWFPAQKGIKYGKGKWLIPGGTTVMTCAPFLAKMLGWNNVTMFGADSSFKPEGRYAYPDNTYVEDSQRPINWVRCNGEGPFPTELLLCKQVSMLGVLAQLPGIKVSFRCGGLMDAYLRAPMEEYPADAEIYIPELCRETVNVPAT
jgi:hypothetical protein